MNFEIQVQFRRVSYLQRLLALKARGKLHMHRINSDTMPKNNGHYSQCIEHAGSLYISGQLPIDSSTKSTPDSIQDQTALALSNIEAILKAAECCKEDIIQVRIYLVGVEHWGSVNDTYSIFFGDHRPARCIVPVPELHFGCLIEIEAIAMARS